MKVAHIFRQTAISFIALRTAVSVVLLEFQAVPSISPQSLSNPFPTFHAVSPELILTLSDSWGKKCKWLALLAVCLTFLGLQHGTTFF